MKEKNKILENYSNMDENGNISKSNFEEKTGDYLELCAQLGMDDDQYKYTKEYIHSVLRAQIIEIRNWARKIYKKENVFYDIMEQQRFDGFNQALDYLMRKLRNDT